MLCRTLKVKNSTLNWTSSYHLTYFVDLHLYVLHTCMILFPSQGFYGQCFGEDRIVVIKDSIPVKKNKLDPKKVW